MNTQTILKPGLCFILLGLLVFSGCSANTYGVRKVEFSDPQAPGQDETSIFVFRENSAFGAARKFAIVCNDTVMGVLNAGTFCHFNVKSAENEIVAYMTGPIMHYRVQDHPGQTLYLYCKMGYASGMFIKEISEGKAKKFMNEFKYTEIDVKGKKTKINYKDYYDKLFQ
jgi:hypothetical protein